MKENTQHTHKKRRSFLGSYPMVFIVVFLLFSFLFIRGGVEVYAKQKDITERKNLLLIEFDELSEYHESLEGRVGQIDSDYGLEKYIRETYGLIRPGEEVFYVVHEDVEVVEFDKKEKKGLFKRLLE